MYGQTLLKHVSCECLSMQEAGWPGPCGLRVMIWACSHVLGCVGTRVLHVWGTAPSTETAMKYLVRDNILYTHPRMCLKSHIHIQYFVLSSTNINISKQLI